MQTITTRYVAPTATQGAYIIAEHTGGRKSHRESPTNHPDHDAAHAAAANVLRVALGWGPMYHAGTVRLVRSRLANKEVEVWALQHHVQRSQRIEEGS